MALFRGTPIQFEPLKENRFFLEFPSELGIEVWEVLSVKRPSININRVAIPYFDQEVGVTGKITFGTIDIELIAHIAPSTSQKVMEWVRLHHEILTGRSGYSFGYKKTLTIKQTDPNGVEVDKFVLFDCQIVSVDFGSNTYDSDAVQKVRFSVHPDRVETPV
jgi:hypothetical protein